MDDDMRRRWTELVQELIAQGMDEDEARFAAVIQLGISDGDVVPPVHTEAEDDETIPR